MSDQERALRVLIGLVLIFIGLCIAGRACAYECDEINDRDLRLACVAQVRHDRHACEEMNDHDMRALCRNAVTCNGNRACLMKAKHKGD